MTARDIRRTLQSEFVRTLRKPFVDAVKEYDMVQAGDRIAVCISGGKDSMLLALLMQDLQRTVDFELVFLAMDPGYAPAGRAHLEENAARLGLPLEIFETNVLRVAGNHAADHPCFLCAKMRRGHLYTEAQRHGCNKIALGHHYDDAIETVLMGLIYGGQVQAMLPRVKAKNYAGMELIRPLYLTREKSVQAWADFCG
ncbi:MAG TPA: tRNA 2-thiocytidine biosynthesis TtcA family protein, partial [Candidatus Agathobaculum intestinigallinarum]|nr:tRNA 2-thiocytidine biosynthesis TtcA family protein [Candidatus Agathobaculum intestinigallinarum]